MSTVPTNIASSMAPSFAMVKKYFIASVISFVCMCALMLMFYADIHGHHFQPKLLALTHVAALGWVSMIIFGAMYQLIPVVLEVKLYSERIAQVQFWLYVVGIVGLVYGFWFFRVGYHLAASASLLTIAIFLFVVNVVATMARVTRWNITGLFLLTSLVYLAATAAAGLLLSINLGFPFISRIHLDYLKIHAHLGFVGWVVMVIMGVALKLIPMFGLSHGFSTAPAKTAYVLVNLGLLGTTVEWLFTGSEWLLNAYIGVLVLGILFFLYQLVLIFKHRMRLSLDLGMKHTAVAFGYFLLAMLTGVVIAYVDFGNKDLNEAIVLAYGFMILFGFFSMLIVGQMYKIVPFLVWFHTFSDKVGKEPVPMLKDMFSESIGTAQFWMLNGGIVLVLGGMLSRVQWLILAGCVLLLLASLIFAYNIAHVFLIRRRYGNERTNP